MARACPCSSIPAWNHCTAPGENCFSDLLESRHNKTPWDLILFHSWSGGKCQLCPLPQTCPHFVPAAPSCSSNMDFSSSCCHQPLADHRSSLHSCVSVLEPLPSPAAPRWSLSWGCCGHSGMGQHWAREILPHTAFAPAPCCWKLLPQHAIRTTELYYHSRWERAPGSLSLT